MHSICYYERDGGSESGYEMVKVKALVDDGVYKIMLGSAEGHGIFAALHCTST